MAIVSERHHQLHRHSPALLIKPSIPAQDAVVSAATGFMVNLSQLAADRLLPVLPLLQERGLVSPEIALFGSLIRDGRVVGNSPSADRLVLEALHRGGVRVLVMKGTLLAHTVYQAPEQRLRLDTDLFVPSEERFRAEEVLRDLGLAPFSALSANMIDTQGIWVGELDGHEITIDLHWLLFNNPVFADVVAFEDLWERRQPFTLAGYTASGLEYGDALLHAALHYFVHHGSSQQPAQWLLDGDLLWQQMVPTAREELVHRSLHLGVSGILGAFLRKTKDHFHTEIDDDVLDQLHSEGQYEWRSGILRVNGSLLREQLLILQALGSNRKRAAHLRRLLFPSKAWMLQKYPHANQLSLPWLYLRRAVEGWNKRYRS